MNFTVLTPSDTPVQNSKSDTVDGNFGGNREHSQTSDNKDYTKRTGSAPSKKENPVENVIKDVDSMANSTTRKREFSYQENKMDVQKNNEANFITKSDSDNQPPEDTDGFVPDPTDPNFLIKTRRSKLKGHFGDGPYDGSRGEYEGELS